VIASRRSGGAAALFEREKPPFLTSPDTVEYPDKGEFAAGAKSLSQRGEPFLVRLPIPDE
jgi:hypothetical protein